MQGIEYYVRAVLDFTKSAASSANLQKFSESLISAGQKFQAAGDRMIGSTFRIAAGFAKAAASAGLIGGALGLGRAIMSGVKFNEQLETMKYSMASTLQLMGHSSGDFARNLDVSQAAMDKLYMIAAASPATFEQTSQMFNNMLPGARSVTGNMEEILQLTKESLALGMIMGGDFATTGSQLSRILTGGAGADFETWKVLQKPIMDAGKAAGYFSENLQMGTKLTEKFNRLSPEQRLELTKKAMEKLGVATDAFGTTWAGLISTVESDFQILKKALGKSVFEKIKEQVGQMAALGSGGVLDPEGETMAKLTSFASFIGDKLGNVTQRLLKGLEKFITNFADNWQFYVEKFGEYADLVFRAGKAFLKAKVAMAGAGVAAKAVGVGVQGAGMAYEGLKTIWPLIQKMGIWSLVLVPILAILGTALIAVGAIFAGIGAYVVTKWKEIYSAVESGAVHFQPLFDAIDHFWAKLVALGGTFFQGGTTTSMVQSAVDMLTNALYGLMGVISFGLRVLGVFQFVFNAVQMGLRTIYLGFTYIITGIVTMIKGALEYLPGMDGVAANLQTTLNNLNKSSQKTLGNIMMDSQESTAMFERARAFDDAFATPGTGPSEAIKKAAQSWIDEAQKKMDDDLLKGESAKSPKVPKGGNVHIHKMVVNQDLRNHDPDRIIGAFYSAVDKSIRNRTQSLAQAEQGT